MSMTVWLLVGALWAGDDATEPPMPAVVDPGKQSPADKPAESRKRLQRKEDKKAAKVSMSDDKAPAEEDARIPKPEEVKPPAELEERLLDELGRDLESGPQGDEDLLTKIAQNMRESEERLARASEKEETVLLQEQIVRDLQKFLEDAQQQQQNQAKQSMTKMKKKRPLTPQERQQLAEAARRRQMLAQREGRRPANEAGPPRSAQEKLSPQEENRAIWGHLSELMRAEMNQYAKENFLAKYRDMIERYYTDISRRSQRSGD